MTFKVFLSASIPLLDRHERFWKTSDNVAIREAVKALTAEIIQVRGLLIFGGHPAITPLVSHTFNRVGMNARDHVLLYQSALFERQLPAENEHFPRQILTPKIGEGDHEDPATRKRSLRHMRTRMFEENQFSCAVFIGGMEGIFEEHELLSEIQPNAPKFPIASTGAAAAIAYEKYGYDVPELVSELTYSTLFRRMFKSLQS